MTSKYVNDFGPFEESIWMNTAHQGPLPRKAVKEAYKAISLKVVPIKMTTELFTRVPLFLKQLIGRLINVPSHEIILANSSSYGLHLLANGINWQSGDEILVVRGDFPATILPWLSLEEKGVIVKQIVPQGPMLQVEDLETHLTSSTRVLCVTLVHSFTGYALDEIAIGEFCQEHNITFILASSQGIGAREFDANIAPVDAITSVGFKWLCGPYGTGFCWMRESLLESLEYNQAYWLAMQTADDLEQELELHLRTDLGAKKYDIFGTANFFNFMPWAASLEYLLEKGIEQISLQDQQFVTHLIDGLDQKYYDVLSPRSGPARSTLVFVSHKLPERNKEIYDMLKRADIYIAIRKNKLRFSPHLHNTLEDIERILAVLNEVGSS